MEDKQSINISSLVKMYAPAVKYKRISGKQF